ncbi:MAG: selenite/tellurite reduction operon c-type cytochrome lipoprotein ExtS [Desulfuromonadaceae bacterium]
MVAALLIVVALLTTALPTWGGVGQVRQLCLSCHPVHYAERGLCTGCHLGNPGSARKNIAHAGLREGKYARFTLGDGVYLKKGQQLLDQLACRRCHVSSGRGNRLAVNLDRSVVRKTAGETALSVQRPVTSMPDFALHESQITAVVNVVLAGSVGRETAVAEPVRVHFNNSGKNGADIFSRKCGSCHRMLGERLGAVGNGAIGPNLSGLLSEYYPATFRDGEVWNASRLSSWLKNPRTIKPWARMVPVTLTPAETRELQSALLVSPTHDK